MSILKRLSNIGGLILLIIVTTSICMNASVVEVIKNPKPNMVEEKYVALTLVNTLNPDLGNSEFLYGPYSLATNGTHIYIYDTLQAKLFKLDQNLKFVKSYGRKGLGPGEFSSTGKSYPVYIKFGKDGLLYTYDLVIRRLMVFNEDLKYLRLFVKVPSIRCSPVVNENGEKYFFSVNEDKTINIVDEKKSKYFVITDCKESFKFLIDKPRFRKGNRLIYSMFTHQLNIGMTPNSELYVYIPFSSTLLVASNGKLLLKKHLWPKNALINMENELQGASDQKSKLTRYLFHNMFMDDDITDVFYLQSVGMDKKTGNVQIYKFNTRGELLKVLYVKSEDIDNYPKFVLKAKGLFYVIDDANLKVFKISEE